MTSTVPTSKVPKETERDPNKDEAKSGTSKWNNEALLCCFLLAGEMGESCTYFLLMLLIFCLILFILDGRVKTHNYLLGSISLVDYWSIEY